jgi:uncharacterized protein YdeI (YjbR/CyaY-like superfamily)
MELGKTLRLDNRAEWRSWLTRYHDKAKEIWLVFHRKASGKARISYNEAVEEALCFGWIDSIVKNVDQESFAQRFTPRKPGSPISEMNRIRVLRLIEQGLMTPAGLAVLGDVNAKSELPVDILKELKKDQAVWDNFQNFPEEYRRIRIAYVEGARKRPEEFERRLRNLLKMTAKNKKFGMVQ